VTPEIEAAFGAALRRVTASGWRGDFATPQPLVGAEFDPLAELPLSPFFIIALKKRKTLWMGDLKAK
jgi:hypothetical protein